MITIRSRRSRALPSVALIGTVKRDVMRRGTKLASAPSIARFAARNSLEVPIGQNLRC
jgi:hypothetical protein